MRRYLLKKHVDLLDTNDDGEVPLHKACQFALKSSNYAFTGIVQLLMDKCASSLHVVNRWNITPKDLLERLEEKLKPIEISESESSASEAGAPDSEEERWSRRLAEEAGAEYEEQYGAYEQDYYDCDNYKEERRSETYDDWADRLFSEFRQKRHAEYEVHRPTKKRHKEEEPNKWAEYQQKLEREHQEYLKRAETKQKTDLLMKKQMYEAKCSILFSTTEFKTDNIRYADIPWPFLPRDRGKKGKNKSKKYSCLDKKSHSEEQKTGLSSANIKEFLLCDLHDESLEAKLKYLKEQRVRWHPDRFAHRCASLLNVSEKENVLDTVKNVSQAINTIVSEFG